MSISFVDKQLYKDSAKVLSISIGVFIMFSLIAFVTNLNFTKVYNYINGFKQQEITSIKDIGSISSEYNTVNYAGDELVNTNIYKTKDKSDDKVAYYYLSKCEDKYVVVLIKLGDIDKIKDGKFQVKGTVTPLSSALKKQIVAKVGNKGQSKNDISAMIIDKYIDAYNNWKVFDALLYGIMLIAILGSALYILKTICFIIIKNGHFIYKQLNALGDIVDLKKIIDEEVAKNTKYTRVGKNYITDNWFIFKTYYNTVFIPHNMIVWAYASKNWKVTSTSSWIFARREYLVEIYLLNGKNYKIPVNMEQRDTILDYIYKLLPSLELKYSSNKLSIWYEEKKNMLEEWKEYTDNRGNAYHCLQNKNNLCNNEIGTNSIIKLRNHVVKRMGKIEIIVDGNAVLMGKSAEIKNDKIFVPVKEIMGHLGGVTQYDAKEKIIKIQIADLNIILKEGESKVTANGREYSIDEAVYSMENTLYVSISFLTGLLEEEVKYDKEEFCLNINHKRTKYTEEQFYFGNSIAANLATINKGNLHLLGWKVRNKSNVQNSREALKEWWGIENRKDILHTVKSLKSGMHNKIFLDIKSHIENLNDEEFWKEVQSFSKEEQKRDLQVVRKYYRELGEKGIIGWDLARIPGIVGWSYISGYLDYEEAVEIIMDTARVMQNNYTSFEEAAKAYLIGYEFWSGDYPEDKESGLYKRLEIHKTLMKDLDSPYNVLAWNMNLYPKER